jgi:hypothetical protein
VRDLMIVAGGAISAMVVARPVRRSSGIVDSA